MLHGKILITGITGSLGVALVERSLEEKWDCEITGIARNESRIGALQKRFPSIRTEVGDVRDIDWLRTIFPGHSTILHCAASKVVPVLESNPREAVLNNILGSMNVAQAAIESEVNRVVGISSDKAAGPTFYGASKRIFEGIFRQANTWGKTTFSLCRYGNVLRSAGSIVLLFEKQIKDDVPFTLTHTQMSRFWLSMRQAVSLVVATAKYADAGAIFVPEAPVMSVYDLAKTLDPSRDVIEIGIRPGERLHETLIIREEAMHTERVPSKYNSYGVGIPLFVVHSPNLPKDSPYWFNTPVPFQYEYTSDRPSHYLSVEEMKELLKDS